MPQDMRLKDYVTWAKQHKLAIVVVAVLAVTAWNFLLPRPLYAGDAYEPGLGYPETAKSYGGASQRSIIVPDDTTGPDALRIKQGYASAKSEDAIADMERLRSRTLELEGWVERESKFESDDTLTVTATLKIPAEGFEDFAAWLKENFDVKDSNFGYYRTELQRQQEEVQILLDAMAAYDRLLARVETMEPTAETAQVILEITQKKLEVARLLKAYGYDIQQTQKQAAYATLDITFTQDKEVKLVPEDIGRQFMLKVRDAIARLTNIGTEIITTPLVVLAEALKWIVYAFVVAIPVFLAYRLLLRVWKSVERKF